MADSPNSYRDPYWSDLAAGTEKKLGLPDGLLVALLTKGERSNSDQVSEAGAKTPFQITPTTRNLVLKRDGIDAYLSDDNAAEVAGLVAKDGVKWAQGRTQDPAAVSRLAAGYYHAGGDTANWGPKTLAYMARVSGKAAPDAADPAQAAAGAPPTAPAATGAPAVPGAMPDGSQSTFDRLSPAPPATTAIENIFKAYTSGQMNPDQAKAFESDVNSGKLMLPRGAKLNAPAGAPSAGSPEANIVAAYNAGQMNPTQAAALEKDVQSGAFKVPAGLALQAPAAAPAAAVPVGTDLVQAAANASPLVGQAEVAAGLGTGMLATPIAGLAGLGTAAGNALGLTDAQPADVVQNVAGALTYQPRSQQAQQAMGVASYPLEKLAQGGNFVGEHVADATGSPALGAAANTAIQVGVPALLGKVGGAVVKSPVAGTVVQAARDAVAPIAERVRAALPTAAAEAAPEATPGTMGSVGAAGVDMATQRRTAAADLPVPIKLTEGQATRDFAQQQFERETAKNPDAGAPIRTRLDDQNAAMAQNIDHFIDQTGAEAPNLRATGVSVDDAVNKAAAADKNEIKVAYKKAETAGELEAPVSLDSVVKHLNDSAPEATTAPILTTARAVALKLGLATEDAGGNLIPQDVSLKTAEQFRQAVNRAVNAEPTNIRQAAIIKGLVDDSTDGAGGTLYKQARALRARFAQNYENHAVISDILSTKRGTADRQVALEDIHKRTILDGSLDDVRQVRRVLQRSADGQQAWRELQGQTLNYIKDQALGNSARDSRGNPIMSAAKLDKVIKSLDADGKLDFVFGKKGAAQLRTINDVAKDVYTSPPGSVNHSNTASVLAGLLDLGMTTFTGLPIPVASGARYLVAHMRDKKLAARVSEALNKDAAKAPKNMRPAPRPMNAPASTARN